MPSPFPGMDPFLEYHWADVRTSLAASIRSSLREQLPPGLVARVEERVVLEIAFEDADEIKRERIHPDVGAFDVVRAGYSKHPAGVAFAVSTPLYMRSKYVRRTQRSVNIHETKGMRVVTAIELISPANKIGIKSRAAYAARQEKLLDAGVSLVEIDLLRQGKHVLYCPPIGEKGHYAIDVIRGWEPEHIAVYPARFDAPLPTVEIPLRKRDADAILALQPLLDEAYIDGSYEKTDYTQPLKPPFTAAENRWLKAQLKKRK